MIPQKERKLLSLVDRRTGQQFVWGQMDCTIFAAEVADVITGARLADDLRGKWHDQKSAWRFSIKNQLTVESWLRENGAVDVRKGFEQTGDFILMERRTAHKRRWRSVAICLGMSAVVMTEEAGLVRILMKDLPDYVSVLRLRGI